MLIFVNKGRKCHSESVLRECTWYAAKPVERGREHNPGLLVAQAFSFVSIHLIQSETTQHAKLKLAGKKGVSE